jgi:hypothetical protein
MTTEIQPVMIIGWIILFIGSATMLGDLLIPFFIGRKYPNYNHLNDTISTLGTAKSPVRKQLSMWLISLGVLFVIFSLGHLFVFDEISWKHWLYLIGIGAFGIGSTLAGIFPEDERGIEETPSGKIHGISSGIGFILLILNPLWMFLFLENHVMKILNLSFFITAIVTFILFMASYKTKSGNHTGLWQRLNLISLYSPLITNLIFLLV